MNFKNASWILPLFLAVSCSQTPSIDTNPTASSKVLGTVSLGVGADAGSSSVHISPRAALPDNAVTFGTPTFVTFNDTNTSTRYLSARFPVTNNTATAFTNLTLHAYNKNGSGIGGTAIQNLVNFNGANSATTNAQSLLPIHKTDAVGLPPAPTIDQSNADFQGFNVDDTQVLTTQALALVPNTITASDTILQYGFVVRNATGGRVIAANGTGTVTIAYKLPDANVNAAYKFIANFVLSEDNLNTRVTRGLGDTALAADSRATLINADEVFLVGNDSVITVNTQQQVTNILTSNAPVCLVSTLACSLTTTVSSTGTGSALVLNPYGIGITATPAAGTALIDIEVDWGDGTLPQNLAPSATTASHSYAVAGAYTITITASDNNGDTAQILTSVTVI
jgi:PKD domain